MAVRIPKFIKRVLSFIFTESHLTFYKQILLQQRKQKIVRLYQDNSYIDYDSQQQYQPDNQLDLTINRVLNSLYNFAYPKNQCINPCIKKLLIWYFLVFISFMYFFIEVGMLIAFGPPVEMQLQNTPGYQIASTVFLLILYIDIVMQFITGYIHQGVLIRQPQKVVAHYLGYLFWFDLSFVIIQSIAMNSCSFEINYFKLFIFLKFIRLLQIDKFYLRRLSLHKVFKVIYVIFKQMVIIYLASSIIGIIFYMIDYYFVNTPVCEGANQEFCWLYNATAYSPIIELSYSLQYFYIIYYGISTISTISYGDIQAKNPWQQIYQIPIMLFSFIIYAYIINNIVSIIVWVRKDIDEYKAERLLIDLYMKELKIQNQLKVEIHSYLQFLYIEQLNRDKELEEQLIGKLPEDLQSELLQGLYSEIYNQLVYMFRLSDEVKGLLSHIEESIYTINQQIMVQNEFIDKLLYIERGQVKLDCQFNTNHFQITKITYGNFVALNHFMKQDKLPFSIIAQKSVNIYSLDHQYLQENCNDFSFKQSMRSLQYFVNVGCNYAKISEHCYYCTENHIWNDCPQKFPYFKNIQLMSSNQVKFQRQRAKQRGLRHNVLICRKDLKVLEVFAKIGEDEFYNRIQRRIKIIRQRIEISKQLFEVDAAYDWQIYLPEENLSKLRLVWQSKKLQNNLARKSVFRLSRATSL